MWNSSQRCSGKRPTNTQPWLNHEEKPKWFSLMALFPRAEGINDEEFLLAPALETTKQSHGRGDPGQPCHDGLEFSFEGKPDGVLADGDQVAVAELPFDDRLAVHERAVGAAQVADPERPTAPLNAPVTACSG